MSTATKRRALALGLAAMLTAAALPAAASALTTTSSDAQSVLVPTGSPPHDDCVTSATTGPVCEHSDGGPDVTATAGYTATAAVTPPSVANVACPGGFATSASTGAATLSGGATVSGYLVSPTPVPLGSTSVPGDTVVVSHCITP